MKRRFNLSLDADIYSFFKTYAKARRRSVTSLLSEYISMVKLSHDQDIEVLKKWAGNQITVMPVKSEPLTQEAARELGEADKE